MPESLNHTPSAQAYHVIGGGSMYPHYIFLAGIEVVGLAGIEVVGLAGIEVVGLALIIWYAWRWPVQDKTAAQLAM